MDPRQHGQIGMSWLSMVRFGPGIASKLAYAFIALMAVFGIAIFRLGSDAAILAISLLAAGCAYYFMSRMLQYAREHPGPALLEGRDLTTWQRAEIRAKAMPMTYDAPQPDPRTDRVGAGRDDDAAEGLDREERL